MIFLSYSPDTTTPANFFSHGCVCLSQLYINIILQQCARVNYSLQNKKSNCVLNLPIVRSVWCDPILMKQEKTNPKPLSAFSMLPSGHLFPGRINPTLCHVACPEIMPYLYPCPLLSYFSWQFLKSTIFFFEPRKSQLLFLSVNN